MNAIFCTERDSRGALSPRGGGSSSPAVLGCSVFTRLKSDDEGAIMVIAVFMAAVVVGVIWYTFGLGEAMIYRQQLRAAVDAAAFDSAVVHALGMNMIAMINVAMAAVLSILVLLMMIFLIGLLLTVIDIALLLIPFVDIAAAAFLPELIDFDETMFSLIKKADPIIFNTLTALNVSAGWTAIVMPFAGLAASTQPGDDYHGAVDSTSSFSPSMIPLRLPYFSNKLDAALKDKLPTWTVTGDHKIQPSAKIPETQRYGLPVQDDTYGILCTHAGMELVDEGAELIHLVTGGLITISPKILNKFGGVLGEIVGAVPWLFCSGLDPALMLDNLIGGGGIGSKVLDGILKKAKDLSSKKYVSMFPMKPFDLTSNGADWNQVWASAKGSTTLATGAIEGVAVAGFGTVAPDQNEEQITKDFAEAEFYYDCGSSESGDDLMVLGADDTTGDWQQCKYNALWNLRWKVRLRRYHQFQYDIRKDIETSLYQGLGIDSFFKSFLPKSFEEGGAAKMQILDRIKSCITNLGSGSNPNAADVGACPIPDGNWIPIPNGGKIGIGTSTPDGYSMDQVLH